MKKMIDADRLIKRLQWRIDEYIAKYPDKKNSVAVESVRELIHVIDLEAGKKKTCDLWEKIPRDLVDDVFRRCPEASAEMDSSFLGFEEIYQRVAKEVPHNMTIIDFGCAYAFQSWYFRDFELYIGVDNGVPSGGRLWTENSAHYTTSIQDYIKDYNSDGMYEDIFAICSYVQDEKARELVRKCYPRHYVYYPGIIDDWRL